MELVTGAEENLAELKSACAGRRVGVYPGAHGRFVSDLSRRLDGFDVAGLYRPHSGIRDQGLPVIEGLDEFLDSVDTVLLWGFDECAADVLYRALARERHPRFINVLDPAHPQGLTRPRRPMRFADFHDPGPEDRAVLDEERLDAEALRRAFYRDDDLERAFARETGVTGRGNRFDGVLAPFETTLLECGLAFCPCPVCGRTIASDQAFALRQNELHFITAHRFVCHGEYYLFKTLPITVGMYLPDRELFVNARPRAESMRYMFFEPHQIASVIHRFRLQCLRRPEAAVRYASGSSKKRLLLFGNYYNLGHQVRNELAGVQNLLDRGLPGAFDNVLVTLSDLFHAAELFPEVPRLADAPRLTGMDRDRQAFESFRYGVDGDFLPVMFHFGGDFQESLARRMMLQAERRSTGAALELARRARQGSPALWITLRSTRAWTGQDAGFAHLLTRLHARWPDMCAVFDGLAVERTRLEAIRQGLPSGLAVVDALGLNPFETIHLAGHVDAHVSPLGTGATFLGIVNKPGVFHGGRQIMNDYLIPAGGGSWASLPRENPALNLAVRAVSEDESVEMHVRGYELNVDELFQAVCGVLERLGF